MERSRHIRFDAPYRVCCDSLVALGPASATGRALFAKNSDRPALECQVLVQVPAARHPRGQMLQCQYLGIPQVEETFAVIGSRPYWLWGFEHGVNQWGVVAGNHSVFTKDSLPESGLLGMDLVRLGLERSRSATEALEIIADLIERHGQGGSGYEHTSWPYNNSFLIADAGEAWELEASHRYWCARKVQRTASLSNHVVIGTDWDRIGREVTEHAISRGWWAPEEGGRIDFASAYRDYNVVPAQVSEGRHRRTCDFLSDRAGGICAASLRQLMRDHYDGGEVYQPGRTPAEEEYFTLCMHADPVGTTTASVIVEQPSRLELLSCWACLGSPCAGVYLPYYMLGRLPAEVSVGGGKPSPDSPWWRFRNLLSVVEKDFTTKGPVVRHFWDELEAEVARDAAAIEAEATTLLASGKRASAATLLTNFMQANVRETLDRLSLITSRVS